MGIAAIPVPDGIKSVQDLYNLMSGETTSVSGGTTTTTAGISPESLNAMLQSALSSSSGLAAVSGGQRTAGGYGSSVNTMLTNDLLTRTAGQIAQAASTKTTTTAPSATTKGGITAEGGLKSAGFLAALQALDKTGAGNWLKKNVFGDSGSVDAPSMESTVSPVANASEMTANIGQHQSSPVYELGQSAGVDMGAQAIIDTSDNPNYYSSSPSNMVQESPAIEPIIETPIFEDIIPMQEGGGYADGGLIGSKGKSSNPILRMADGGSVAAAAKKQLGSMVGQQSNTVVDPRTGLMGKGDLGVNEANMGQAVQPIGQTVNTNQPIEMGGAITSFQQPSQTTDSSNTGFGSALGDKIGASISSGIDSASAMASRAMAGETTKSDVGAVSRGLSAVGMLTGNRAISNLGAIGQIGTSANPVKSAAETVANVATKGVYGKVKQGIEAITNPTAESTVNFVASLNPWSAAYNSVAGFLGVADLGEVAGNVRDMISPNNPMSPQQQQDAKDWSANMVAGTAVGENEDPMDALMASTDAFGTAPTAPTAIDAAPTNQGGGGYTGPTGPTGPQGESISSGSDVGVGYGGSNVADGGHMEGPGTGTSDSIHNVNLSDGEFVLSADTVAAIGVDKLEALQAKYHTPKAVQEAKNPILRAANRRMA